MITLTDLNILLGTIAAVLLIFAELFKIRSHGLGIRLSTSRLRLAAYFSAILFLGTLILLMINTIAQA